MATSDTTNRSKWNAIYANRESARHSDAWILDNALKRLAFGGHLLELGSGRGGLALDLIDHGFRVTVVDISDVALDSIPPTLGLTKLEMDLTEDFPEGQFDGIIAHHFHDRALIAQMKAALRKNGKIIIKTFDERILVSKPHFNPNWILRENDFIMEELKLEWHTFPSPSCDSGVIAYPAHI